MIILLFGVSNVGKTTIGEKLAERIEYKFYDLDKEIKKHFDMTLGEISKIFTQEERDNNRNIVFNEILKNQENKVVAISPISNMLEMQRCLYRKDVLAIELVDDAENIFNRIIFTDENDIEYKDEEYKNKHKKHYLRIIREDILWYKNVYKVINNKFNINNNTVDEVVMKIIKDYSL